MFQRKKHQVPKKKHVTLKKKILIGILVLVAVFVLLSFIGQQGEPSGAELNKDIPIEEVREQASDAFLRNDETVDAADIEIGLS